MSTNSQSLFPVFSVGAFETRFHQRRSQMPAMPGDLELAGGGHGRANGRNLGDVARWNVAQLSAMDRARLFGQGRGVRGVLRLGTACSGSDSPVVALRHLQEACNRRFRVEHVFSCEVCPRKRQWILDNFRGVRYLFEDISQLRNGEARDTVSSAIREVPRVYIFVAGFVCKSVSSENSARHLHASCIANGTGQTGETWSGVMGYLVKFRPALVILENVTGLAKRNRGATPQIQCVMASLNSLGYSADWRRLDTRCFHLPHRRARCWIWGLLGEQPHVAAVSVPATLQMLMTREHTPLDEICCSSFGGFQGGPISTAVVKGRGREKGKRPTIPTTPLISARRTRGSRQIVGEATDCLGENNCKRQEIETHLEEFFKGGVEVSYFII